MNEDAERVLINDTACFVKDRLKQDASGHDWGHVRRVYDLAVHIAQKEPPCDFLVVRLAALLHDIADYKFHDGDHTLGVKVAGAWLCSRSVPADIAEQVCTIMDNISFRGAGVMPSMASVEGKVVQDADRLDAIGAIGIARTFAYGGSKGRPMFSPEVLPAYHDNFDGYKNNRSPTINHFFEKLLLLHEEMNTEEGKIIAVQRQKIMTDFLQEFFSEWEGCALVQKDPLVPELKIDRHQKMLKSFLKQQPR